MRYLKYILFAILAPLVVNSHGQTQRYPAVENIPFESERLLIHTDRQLYISGEIIWFKVWAFATEEERLSNFSRVAYLELISPERIAISRVKITLDHGRGNGSIELPQVLNSGNYLLRAYTQAMRNGAEEDFARTKLIILNPDQAVVRADPAAPDTYAGFVPDQQILPVRPEKMMKIQINPSESLVGQRQEVTLEITTTDANGRSLAADLSLSVALTAGEREAKPLYSVDRSLPSGSRSQPARITFQPENEGMLLNGRVIDELTQNGAPQAQVFLAFPGEKALVYMAKTDNEGGFSFKLPELYGLRQLVLQTHPDDTRSLRMELAESFHPVSPADKIPFILPPDWVPIANAALINAQVQQSYQSFELPPVYEVETLFDTVPFFGHSEALYRLDDYNRFPLPEFFFEIVLEVAVKGKYGSERLEVINEWENLPFENPNPLFLVDGVPVFDQRTFLKINNKLIESAEIVTEPFWLNPLFYNGIIQLISFEKDGRCFRLPENALQRSLLTLLPDRQFQVPDYLTQPDSRLPDFRNTLYWEPSVRTDENGKATLTFYTADTVGDFEIHVEGTSEEGYLGSAIDRIEVVKEVK